MSIDARVPRNREVPEIVPIVLKQLTRLRAEDDISEQKFDAQLNRLSAEELEPRGLSLSVRELPEGHRRFVIHDARGAVQQMIDCNGTCDVVQAESDEAVERQAAQGAN